MMYTVELLVKKSARTLLSRDLISVITNTASLSQCSVATLWEQSSTINTKLQFIHANINTHSPTRN